MKEPKIPKGRVVERGITPCVECGRPHDRRDWSKRQKLYWQMKDDRMLAPMWSDPKDGHAYQRENAEVVLRRVYAALGLREGGQRWPPG